MSAGAILVIVHALGSNSGVFDVEHFPDLAACDAAVVSLRQMERELGDESWFSPMSEFGRLTVECRDLAEPPRSSRDGGAADGSGVPR